MRFVFKFGGSSLSSTLKIKKVASFIKEIVSRPNIELIIVVSAMGKTTDKLDKMARSVSSCPEPMAYNSLITTGEIVSASLLALALEELNIPSVCLSAKDIKLYAQGDPKNAIITHIDKQRIESELEKGKVVVVTGFQGVNNSNNFMLLGRGGSDTTAVALGIVFNAEVKIYTDVLGYYICDPKKIAKSRKLDVININSAIEVAPVGAKVLDYRCLELANKYKKSLEVLESCKSNGTKIIFDKLENYHIDNITYKKNLLFVKNIYNNNRKIRLNFKIDTLTTLLYSEERLKNKILQTIVASLGKNYIDEIYNHKKYNNIQIKECEMLVLTGSGFITHTDFMEKVQKIIKNTKIYTLYVYLSASCLKIVTKKNRAEVLAKAFAEEFKEVKEV